MRHFAPRFADLRTAIGQLGEVKSPSSGNSALSLDGIKAWKGFVDPSPESGVKSGSAGTSNLAGVMQSCSS